MAKSSGKAAGGFGKAHGGADNLKNKLVVGAMSPKMMGKGGKTGGKSMGKKGY